MNVTATRSAAITSVPSGNLDYRNPAGRGNWTLFSEVWKEISTVFIKFGHVHGLRDSISFCSGWKGSMNPSYFNGPFHEWVKRFEKDATEVSGVINWLCYGILMHFCYICFLWSIPDGPVFIVKLLIAFLDKYLPSFYCLNQNPICRSQNHSTILSKKQNIEWFL